MRFLLRLSLRAKLIVLTIFAVMFFTALFLYIAQDNSDRAVQLVLNERLHAAKLGATIVDHVLEDGAKRLQRLAKEPEVAPPSATKELRDELEQ